MRNGFVAQCESTRYQRSISVLSRSDVYDGTLWNEFLTVNNVLFLTECHNYALLMNIVWLQPFKHFEYSVGVIYLVMNLP